jgi:hypothetical protein
MPNTVQHLLAGNTNDLLHNDENARHPGGRFFVLNFPELTVNGAAIGFTTLYDFDRYNCSAFYYLRGDLWAQTTEKSTISGT